MIVYDMRIGLVRQIPDGDKVTGRVLEVLTAARAGGYRVFFTRHMNLPPAQSGVSQLRRAMAWQRAGSLEEVTPFMQRDSPSSRLCQSSPRITHPSPVPVNGERQPCTAACDRARSRLPADLYGGPHS